MAGAPGSALAGAPGSALAAQPPGSPDEHRLAA